MKSEVQKTVLETIDEMYDKIFQAERKVADFVRKMPVLVVNAKCSQSPGI